jgi:hypothetical protein
VGSTRNLSRGVAVVVTASAAAFGLCPSAAADPAAPPPTPPQTNSAAGLPGLPALSELSPIIQQAAGNPGQATQLLMAAAQAFTHNPTAPAESNRVAASVNQFVQEPGAPVPGAPVAAPNGVPLADTLPLEHVPAAGVQPGQQSHLPQGIDPVHAVGPGPAAPPGTVVVPGPLVALGPAAAPAPAAAPGPAPGPAPAAAPGPAPGPAPAAAPAPAPAPAAAAPAPGPAPGPAPAAAPGYGPDAPTTQDFMYPSIGSNCLADGSSALAAALSVAGPATIPLPGPKAGQTAYVFTAVGTPGPAAVQKLPLNVTWVNLTTGKSGTVTLQPRTDINPDGPTTLTAIADTGSGSIMSTIFGQVTTKEKQCQFMPTIGSTVVP